jgi:hypothetical protein
MNISYYGHPLEMYPGCVNKETGEDKRVCKQYYFEEEPKILNYEYLSETTLSKKDMTHTISVFMEDVNHVKDGKYDDPDDVVVNTPTHFTKLPTLYRQLKEDPCLHYPIWYYPNGNMFSGLGRTLIITRYFREMTLDKVVCNTQDGGSVQDLIDRISQSRYWKNKSLTGMNAVVMIANVEAPPHQLFVRQLEFSDKISDQFLSGPWVESYLHMDDLWREMKKLILSFDTSEPRDYLRLLDELIRIDA